MNLVMFSGNSIANRDWAYAVDSHVDELFEHTYIQEYRHWRTGNQLIDIDYEEVAAAHHIAELKPYIIFAKSLGCALALKGIADGIFTPERCVFVGLPIASITELNLPAKQWLEKLTVPVTIVQNEHDPYGSYEDVAAYIGNTTVTLIKAPGDTHDYLNFTHIHQLLST